MCRGVVTAGVTRGLLDCRNLAFVFERLFSSSRNTELPRFGLSMGDKDLLLLDYIDMRKTSITRIQCVAHDPRSRIG